jgi:hypothetical protein
MFSNPKKVLEVQKAISLMKKRTIRGDLSFADGDIIYKGESILPFELRNYQKDIYNDRSKRKMLLLPRRSGKDATSFVLCLNHALQNPNANIIYLFPNLLAGRRIIWDGVFINGEQTVKYIDIVPKDLVLHKNNQSMRITFYNGASIHLLGAENTDRLRGLTSNFVAVSEYCFIKDNIMPIISPIVSSSNGTLVMNSTPNGRNKAWHLIQSWKKQDSWSVFHETCETLLDNDDKRYITDDMIEDSIANGLSKTLVQQEFYCNPVLDVNHTIYGYDMMYTVQIIPDLYRTNNRKIYFAADLGILDSTAIVGFTLDLNGNIKIIWEYEANNQPWSHYYNVINSTFRGENTIILPHDSAKRDGNLTSVADHFANFGFSVVKLKRPRFLDGLISLVKSKMGLLSIDNDCRGVIEALEQYKKNPETNKPIHDEYSHYASAVGYMMMAIDEGVIHDRVFHAQQY